MTSQNGDYTSSKSPQKPKMQSKPQEGSRSSTVSQEGRGDVGRSTISEHLVGSLVPSSRTDRTERAKRGDEASSHHSLRTSPAIQSNLPMPNTSSSSACPNNVSTGFVTGEDFIAFDFSEDEAEEDRPLQSTPGEGKEKECAVGVVREKQNGLKRSAEQMEAGGSEYANKAQRADAVSRQTPWMRNVDWDNCRNLAELCAYFVMGLRCMLTECFLVPACSYGRTHKEVKAFVEYISPTPEEHEVRSMVITSIARAIKSTWPDARISPFGSFETKLYLPLGYLLHYSTYFGFVKLKHNASQGYRPGDRITRHGAL